MYYCPIETSNGADLHHTAVPDGNHPDDRQRVCGRVVCAAGNSASELRDLLLSWMLTSATGRKTFSMHITSNVQPVVPVEERARS